MAGEPIVVDELIKFWEEGLKQMFDPSESTVEGLENLLTPQQILENLIEIKNCGFTQLDQLNDLQQESYKQARDCYDLLNKQVEYQ